MRCSRFLIAGLLGFGLVQSALAECFICDEVVELDAVRAGCFLSDFESHIANIRNSENRRAEVNLAPCTGEVAAGTRGLEVFPELPDGGEREAVGDSQLDLRLVYVLEETSALCLKELLENLQEPIDPMIRIDLVESCGQ